MHYLVKALKKLLILLSILLIHTLVLAKILNHSTEKHIVPSPKPLKVNLITPEPIIPKTSSIKSVSSPIQKKFLKKPSHVKLKKNRKRVLKRKKVRKIRKKVQKVQKVQKIRKINTIKKSYNRLNSYQKSAIADQIVLSRNVEKLAIPQKTFHHTSSSQISHSRQTTQGMKTSASINLNKKTGKTIPPSYQAAYLYNQPPPYPRISKRRGEEGTVLLRIKVNKNGKAALIQIQKSSGSKRLDHAAHQAVNKWRFIPAKKEGKVVSGWVIVPIVFQLR